MRHSLKLALVVVVVIVLVVVIVDMLEIPEIPKGARHEQTVIETHTYTYKHVHTCHIAQKYA